MFEQTSSELTAAVIALNAEASLPGCLESLRWAGRLLVVDGGSKDRTLAMASHSRARVVCRPFDTFARQRNYALQQIETDWVFFVDADERVPQALAVEISDVLGRKRSPAAARAMTGAPDGYWVPRKNLMLGRWVRHAGWWPDYQLRLFRRDAGQYDEARDPHEVLRIAGPTDRLQEPLVHINYTSIIEMFSRQERYALRSAASLARRGVRPRLRGIAGGPAREFWRRFVALEGYKDGPMGLLLGAVMAWHEYRVQIHLWEERRRAAPQ